MNPTSSTLTAADLERRLSDTDAAVVLAPPRILRRVIKKHSGLGGLGLQVPHRKSYVLRRDDLFAIASRQELGLPTERRLPDTVILLPQPAAVKLSALPRAITLRKYWRLLFHAHIHL